MTLEVPQIIKAASIPPGLRDWTPKSLTGKTVLRALPYLPEDLALELKERMSSMLAIETSLRLRHLRADGSVIGDHGIVSQRLVTDVGVAFLVDAWQNVVELEIMKYHGIGLGTTGAAVGNTDMETELTTQYVSDNVRATGSLTEGASANIFKTVGTNTVDASAAVTEHGVLLLGRCERRRGARPLHQRQPAQGCPCPDRRQGQRAWGPQQVGHLRRR